ncbi:MAG: hypothetical protein MZW92_01260 [Comamonadaceae bacterium]|nr:hypothetical protein [Comamonadaceae bacterium]
MLIGCWRCSRSIAADRAELPGRSEPGARTASRATVVIHAASGAGRGQAHAAWAEPARRIL